MRLRFDDRDRGIPRVARRHRVLAQDGIAWLTAKRMAPPLLVMHDQIVEALRGLHILIDERKLMLHATLARRIEAVVARRVVPPIDWHIGSFVRVASVLYPAGGGMTS